MGSRQSFGGFADIPLITNEAALVTQELGNVIFIGAVAVILHTGVQRQSADIDFVAMRDITKEEFLDKDYKVDFYSEKLYTPRGIKIDLYKGRDLAGIPLDYIRNTAVSKYVSGVAVNIISLEGLIISKYRSGRNIDVNDFKLLMHGCSNQIDWHEIERLVKSDTELLDLKNIVRI